MACVDRILGCQRRPPLLANPTFQWQGFNPRLKMTERLNPAGFQVLRLGDREALHQVNNADISYLVSLCWRLNI